MVAIGIFCNNPSNFDEKQCISVETISVMSNFDGYSDFKDTKKVASILATFFSILCFLFVFSLFSEFLFEPLVECHVGTDFLLVLRLGKCQYVAR